MNSRNLISYEECNMLFLNERTWLYWFSVYVLIVPTLCKRTVADLFLVNQSYSGEEELCCVYVPTNHLYIGDIFLVNCKDVIRPNLSVREGIGKGIISLFVISKSNGTTKEKEAERCSAIQDPFRPSLLVWVMSLGPLICVNGATTPNQKYIIGKLVLIHHSEIE